VGIRKNLKILRIFILPTFLI